MGFHTFDPGRADELEDPTRYAYLSVDELLALFDPGPEDVVADLGSGTGFYTDDVAAAAGRVYAVDVQPAMHDRYREHGMRDNVVPVTATVDSLPFEDALDAVEFCERAGIEVHRAEDRRETFVLEGTV